MARLTGAVVPSMLLAIAVLMPQEQPKPPEPGIVLDGTIVNVVDGDTVDIEFKRRVRVRLRDCWAPETRTTDPVEKQRGLAAKHFVMGWEGQPARLVVNTDGDEDWGDGLSFGRAVGDVWVHGYNIAPRIIQAGHATKTKGGK